MTALAALLAAGSVLAGLKASGFVLIPPPFSNKTWWGWSLTLGVLAVVFFVWGSR